jgi:glycerol uptake facilitator-like aquaporin
VVPYIVAQVAGAFGGAVLAWMLYSTLFTQFETVHHMVRGSLESLQLASIFSTYPAPELSIWHAALVEVVITSMLMGMIMALTDDGNGVPKGPGAAVDWHSGGGDRRLDRAAYRLCDESGARFWPEIVHLVRRVGQYRDDRGRDIPYFIVPIIAPLLGPASAPQFIVFLSPIICPVIPAWRKKIRVSVIKMYL